MPPGLLFFFKLTLAIGIFVIIRAAYFVLSGSQYLRVCQDESVSQRGKSQSAPRCRLIRSWTFRQQLVNYVVKPLSGKDSKMGDFACPLGAEPGKGAGSEDSHTSANTPSKYCFFVCHIPVRFMDVSPVGFQSSVLGAHPPGESLKVGVQDGRSKPSPP